MALKKKKGVAAGAAAVAVPEEGGPRKKGRGAMVPAAVVAVGLLGGGWFMGQGGGDAAAVPAETTTTTVAEGAVVALDPITLNLADGRFLKVGIALQKSAEEGGAGHDEGDADPTATYAKALDEAISVLGGRTYAELADPVGRAHAKDELSAKVHAHYDGHVLGIYFTQFVMQ